MKNKAVSSPADEENTRFCFNEHRVHIVHWKHKVLTTQDESQCLSALLLHRINILLFCSAQKHFVKNANTTICLLKYLDIDILTILQGRVLVLNTVRCWIMWHQN